MRIACCTLSKIWWWTNNELIYNDGVIKFFLYTKGKIGGSEELKSLLTYFEETTQENAVDAELEEIQRIVGNIKHSHETEDHYMTLQEIIDHEKDYSFNDGLQTGVQQGIQQGIQGIVRTSVPAKNWIRRKKKPKRHL